MAQQTAYIGLGSNLQNPQQQIQDALQALAAIPQTSLIAVSRWYRSAPLGPADQPDYINAVAQLSTELPPLQLLDQLQAIENAQGRVRKERWGARTLDLDLLLYGDLQLQSERLCIPHTQLKVRNFVLYPLADLAPQLVLPDGSALSALLQSCPPQGLSVISNATCAGAG